jgi:hypothetical protein
MMTCYFLSTNWTFTVAFDKTILTEINMTAWQWENLFLFFKAYSTVLYVFTFWKIIEIIYELYIFLRPCDIKITLQIKNVFNKMN